MVFAPRIVDRDYTYQFAEAGITRLIRGEPDDILYWDEIGECSIQKMEDVSYLIVGIKDTWFREAWFVPLFADKIHEIIESVERAAPKEHQILSALQGLKKR